MHTPGPHEIPTPPPDPCQPKIEDDDLTAAIARAARAVHATRAPADTPPEKPSNPHQPKKIIRKNLRVATGRWTRLYPAVRKTPHLTPLTKLLFAEIIGFASLNSGHCYASTATLARAVACDRASVKRAKRALESAGAIRIARRWNATTRASYTDIIEPVADWTPPNPEEKT